ncbi:MAG: hypothetical protein K6A40_03385 [Solobacterium sp.]|nr:hypothetical protein [Solobacterium sp.]
MILALSTLFVLVVPVHEFKAAPYMTFPASYFLHQSYALASAREHEMVTENGIRICFNEKGNIRKAMTIPFEDGKRIVIELGGGRLVRY